MAFPLVDRAFTLEQCESGPCGGERERDAELIGGDGTQEHLFKLKNFLIPDQRL